MAFRSTYLCLLSTALLLSCKKDEQKPTPEIRQRVFTNGTEIKDEAVKKRFIQQSGIAFTVPTALDPNYIIRFVAPDTATFGTNPIGFSVTKSNNQYLFYSPLTVVINPNQAGTLNNDVGILLKHTSPLVPISLATGFGYVTKEVRVGYGDRSNMRIALLHYRIKRTFSFSSQEAAGSLFNEFNEAAIAGIRAGDTLAIQESSFMVPVQ